MDTGEEAKATVEEAKATGPKEEFQSLVEQLRTVANAIPTHGVSDSFANGKKLHEIADRIVSLAKEL